MNTLYISDLDGTLLNSQKQVSQYTSETINQCIEQGMVFTVATARMPYGCDYRLEDLNLSTPGILTNGVFIYDFMSKKYLHAETIDISNAKKVVKAFTSNNKSCFMYLFSDEGINICFGDESLKQQEQYYSKRALESCGQVYLTEDYEREMKKGMPVYFALTGTKTELTPVCESLDTIEGIHYSCYLNIYNGLYCLEVYSKRASKKHALFKLKELTQCESVVVFGDNYNDIPMIEVADCSYAPANALPEIKAMVTATIESNDDDGVARFLAKEYL